MPEVQQHLAFQGEVNPIVRHRRAQGVAAEALEPGPIARRHHHGRVEIEAVPPRVTRPEPRGGEREQLRGRATLAPRRTGPLPQRPPTLHGGGREDRRFLLP
jgi:hypothetical protein